VLGTTELEPTSDGVLVHRLPASARAQLPDDFRPEVRGAALRRPPGLPHGRAAYRARCACLPHRDRRATRPARRAVRRRRRWWDRAPSLCPL